MDGFLGMIGNMSVRVSKRYKKEDGSYGFIIHLMTDSEDFNPQNEKFAICRYPELDWYSKYGYTDEELDSAIRYVVNKTDSGELIDIE